MKKRYGFLVLFYLSCIVSGCGGGSSAPADKTVRVAAAHYIGTYDNVGPAPFSGTISVTVDGAGQMVGTTNDSRFGAGTVRATSRLTEVGQLTFGVDYEGSSPSVSTETLIRFAQSQKGDLSGKGHESQLGVSRAVQFSMKPVVYYASPTGAATNDGSYEAPFDIDKVTSLEPGDTLYLKAGDYPLVRPLYPHAGSSSARVTIAKDPLAVAHSVTISCGYTEKQDLVGLSSYTNWDGIDLRNSTDANLATFGASHVYIHNVQSSGAQGPGILVGSGDRGGNPGATEDLPGTTNIQVVNCTVTDCVRLNISKDGRRFSPALQVFQANNVLIEGCTVTRCYGEGIGLRTVAESSINNCTVTDTYSVSIYLDNSAHISLSGNVVTASDPTFYRDGHASVGFLMAVEGPPPYAQLGVRFITESNNSFSGSPGRAFYRYTWDTLSDCQDSTGTCSFSSTPIGLLGFPATQYIIQANP